MLNFLVNSQSLHGKWKKLLPKLESELKKAGAEYRIFYSEKETGVGKYAKSLSAAGNTTLIAVGGDGTLNELVSNLVDPASCEIGLIPAGTGNDFAAAAGIPKGAKALNLILNGEAKETDYIECGEGRRSINIVGLGIDVDILDRRLRAKAEGKKMSYFKSLLASLKTYRGLKLSVTVNGETKEYNAFIAAACNGSQFGGGIRICPVAKIDDGQMELLVIDQPKRSKIFFELVSLLMGRILKRKISHRITCTEAHIIPEETQSVQYDGEVFPADGLHAKLISGKLRMYRS